MLHSSTLEHLLDGGVAVRVDEAVAIVQQLLAGEASEGGASEPYGPLALGNVEIAGDGRVRCTGTAATPSVYEAAALLQALLSHAGVIPGALRYTLGRALLEVEAPPFESRQQFAEALQRFERAPRASVIAELSARAAARQPHPSERRRVTAAAAALRRELRDADLRLYTAASRPAVRHVAPRRRGGPIAACVLTGAALILAGSVASTGSRSLLSRPTGAAEPHAAVGRDVVLLPAPTAPVPARPELAIADVAARPRPARARTSAPVTRRAGGDARRGRHAVRTRTPVKPDADRGVIARIRFEWDNPFR